ncbi:gustatory receptor for bitter taste 22e-like [Bactrocera neohumeralis]|uniref:gustatory receptor for bitter taste 22e-like n=1 Tax=Bactrocera neohumeralis TaxID=98809 RepID=UPI00216580F8|nr:gustatory receptor for bitter taste 22e-like [Bactrocera neohumeralis]
MSSRWRIGIARFFYNSTIWFSIAFGILPFRYDSKLQRIYTSKYSFVYSICLNVVIGFVAFAAWPTDDLLEMDLQQHNKLMGLLIRAIVVSHIYTLITIIVINWREYKSVLYIFNEFAAIERTYLAKHADLARSCSTFDACIIWKGVATLLQNISFIFVIFENKSTLSTRAVIVLGFALTMGNVIFLVVLQFYNFIVTTYRCMWILQQRLKYLANQSTMPTPFRNVTCEVYEITGIYLRLMKLCKSFGSVYGQQLLTSNCAIMCTNVQSLYYLRIIWSDKVSDLTAWDIFYTLQAVLINVFDFWLTIAACELALGMARDIAQLLRTFNDFEKLDVEFEKSVGKGFAACNTTELLITKGVRFSINK